MNNIGIMQGRLSKPIGNRIQAFPWDSWEEEFFLAKEIGFNLIDWLVTAERLNENPLLTVQGAKRIRELVSETGIHVGSVCAHCFVECPLLRCTELKLKESLGVLELLIQISSQVCVKYLEIPLLEESEIRNEVELEQIIQIIKPRLEKARQLGVTLAFETSLPAETFSAFLSVLDHPSARATYDTGNSASLGYNPKEELESYGDMLATVHIKDRLVNGKSVPLGQGNTDFATCFSLFRAKKYSGPFILEVARDDDEFESAKNNIAFVRDFLTK